MLEKSVRPGFWDLIDEIDRELELAFLRLLGSRELGAAVSLGEAALAVGGESWRSLLERAEIVTRRMAAQGILEFLPASVAGGGGRAAVRVRLSRRQSQEQLAQSQLN
ncbi:MAG: hypothetical protein PVG79_04285 [Gemmatimonadales bacterium]|jgi:hypothetical protein